MLLSEMPLFHIWRGAASSNFVRVTITKSIAQELSRCRYAKCRHTLDGPHISVILCADGALPELSADNNWDAKYELGKLNNVLILELTRLKAKLGELGCIGPHEFVIPGATSATEAKAVEPETNYRMPFELFEYQGLRRYVSVSPKMADALEKVQYADFLYNRRPNEDSNNACVRLTESYRLFDWGRDMVRDCKNVQPSDLPVDERSRYDGLLQRLAVLGFTQDTNKSAAKLAAVKQPSFTEALYQDRKRAAVQSTKPVVAADNAVNAPLNPMTSSDTKMFQQGHALISAIPSRCANINMDVQTITRVYGWPDEELKAASLALQKACLVYLKVIEKRERKK